MEDITTKVFEALGESRSSKNFFFETGDAIYYAGTLEGQTNVFFSAIVKDTGKKKKLGLMTVPDYDGDIYKNDVEAILNAFETVYNA